MILVIDLFCNHNKVVETYLQVAKIVKLCRKYCVKGNFAFSRNVNYMLFTKIW